MVGLAQKCADHRVKVFISTRPGLRLMIDAAKAAIGTIEETLLLSYERQRAEAAEQDAKWPRKPQEQSAQSLNGA